MDLIKIEASQKATQMSCNGCSFERTITMQWLLVVAVSLCGCQGAEWLAVDMKLKLRLKRATVERWTGTKYPPGQRS